MEKTELGKTNIGANFNGESVFSEKKHMPKSRLALILSAFAAIVIAASINADFALQFVLLAFATALYAISVIIKPGILSVAAPIISATILLWLTSDIKISILLLSFIPAGLMIGFSVLHKRTRAQTIIRAGFVFVAAILAVLLFWLYTTTNSLSYEALDSTIYDLSNNFIDTAKAYGVLNTEQILELGSPVDIFAEAFKINSLGIIICIGLGLAYFSTFLVKQAMKLFSYEEEYFEFDKKWELSISKIAAIVYILSATTYFTFSEYDNLGYPAAIITLYYPLTAGFAAVGLKALCKILKSNKYILLSFFILAVFGGLFSTIEVMIIISVIVGLIRTLLRGKKPILPGKIG